MKTAAEIRTSFLKFFEERAHRIVPSAPVFPQDDPTLLFTNAGMNQFKDVFLGTGKRPYTRAADTQKCIRVSGKHNDLEEVGVDTYHHTLFEMLGNWSFGDYFKKEAIAWAWEYLTEVLGLPKDRLWVTVFGGDEKMGLPADEESEALWRSETDIAPDRVLRFGAKDNFWEMGEVGPCGPCTEIHFDRGLENEAREDGADPKIGVNAGNERFIELWNLVFIQFNREKEGALSPLPARHVDTGMGLERLVAVLQGKPSNYDSELFQAIFRHLERICGRSYGASMSEPDIAFRVIADHIRALCCAIADGALPGNEGRGYVLRRLLRRAARFGRQALEMREPFLFRLVPAVIEIFGEVFPEIPQRREHIEHLVETEEKAFLLTLDKGIGRFEELAKGVAKGGVIPGDDAYDLYATYGFPRDLVELMARERSLSVDGEAWERAESAHREASKGKGAGSWLVEPSTIDDLPATETCFYRGQDGADLSMPVRPLRLVEDRALVLARTPFYAESGGQVGDVGLVEAPGFRFEVRDVQKMGQVVLHLGRLVEGRADALPDEARARVDAGHRHAVMANHTATHLMHWALKEVLGEHASQQGSLVAPDRLRFDVTHPRAIAPEEIERIETLVNERIAEDHALGTTLEELEAAKARGVTALFGEKYDEEVRVVDIGGFSTELCGGTHCERTGQIGAFVITSESALQAGVRRIEAVTRGRAVAWMQERRRTLRDLGLELKVAEPELLRRVKGLQDQIKELKKGGAAKSQADLAQIARRLAESAEERGGARMIVTEVEGVATRDVAALCDRLKADHEEVCGVLAAREGGKLVLAAFAAKTLAGKRVHAGKIVGEVARMLGGGGGGRPDFAQAGAKDAAKLPAALERARELLRTGLEG